MGHGRELSSSDECSFVVDERAASMKSLHSAGEERLQIRGESLRLISEGWWWSSWTGARRLCRPASSEPFSPRSLQRPPVSNRPILLSLSLSMTVTVNSPLLNSHPGLLRVDHKPGGDESWVSCDRSFKKGETIGKLEGLTK